MKKLTCEMCGSTDIVKQDGVFVCQSCGCKYSVEEAKKMMVEVAGSVKIDKSSDLENYIKLAESSVKGCNRDKANEYANKALEIDPENSYAWLLKMKSTNFSSGKSCAESAQNAIKFADPSKLGYTEIEVYTYFCEAFDPMLPSILTNHNTGVGYLESLISPEILAKYDVVLQAYRKKMRKASAALDHDVGEKQKLLDMELNLHIDITKCKYKSDYVQYVTQDSKEKRARDRLDKSKAEKAEVEGMMSDKIAKVAVIRKEINRKKYWDEHANERAALETEKSKLSNQINVLEKEAGEIRNKIEINVKPKPETPNTTEEEKRVQDLEDQSKELSNQLSKLGIFAGKEKKELRSQIASISDEILSLRDEIATKQKEATDIITNYNAEIMREIVKQTGDKQNEIKRLQNRINEIDNELTRDR